VPPKFFVEDSKLVTYLLNSYAARKLKIVPNSGSTGNVYVKPGTLTPEEIIASVENGLYLTSVSGPGYNQVTGDYSMGATGFWIENGKLSFPVSEITVASNILDMFKGIEAIGNDLEIRSSYSSPTLKIAAMRVAGE
jgi:PmbA protein